MTKVGKFFNRVGQQLDPVSLQVGITDHCFNQCVMCGHHRRTIKNELSLATWLNFLGKRKSVKSVCYSGGDPMAYKNFNKVMRYHVNYNIPFSIITAGHIPAYIDLDLLSNAASAAISLDSIRASIYKKQRGGRIGVEDALLGITKLQRAGVRVKLGITVTAHNREYIHEILDYAVVNDRFAKVQIHPAYGSKLKLNIHPDDYPSINLEVFEYSDLDTGSQCAVPYYHAFIDTNGCIYHCCVTAGDTRTEPRGTPLGHISNWDGYLLNRDRFYREWPAYAPRACADCQDRYNNINKEVQQLNTRQIFF